MKDNAVRRIITLVGGLIVTLVVANGCSQGSGRTPTSASTPTSSARTDQTPSARNPEISVIAGEAYDIEQLLLSLVKPYFAKEEPDVNSDPLWAGSMRRQLTRLASVRSRVQALNLPDEEQYRTFEEWLVQLAAAHEGFVDGFVSHDDSRVANAVSLYRDAAAKKAELETLTFHDPLPSPFSGRKSPAGLSIGDCPARIGSGSVGGEYTALLLVPCDSGKASGRVTRIVEAPILYGPYPGAAYFDGLAGQGCGGLVGTYFYPTANSWAELDRAVTCIEAFTP